MISISKKLFCLPKDKITKVIKKINSNKKKICIVVDEKNFFQGVITDGDIRRSIMKHNTIKLLARDVMNPNPVISLFKNINLENLKKLKKLNTNFIIHINKKKKFRSVTFFKDSVEIKKNKNKVLIMAGGKGTRLKHLTKKNPKALVVINKKTIIENIILNFKKNGFYNFIISTGYFGDKIKKFLKNGEKLGVSIEYVSESNPLGTAGSLSLIKDKVNDTFIVINCDVITNMNFKNLLLFHKKNKSYATIAVVEKEFQNMYGVVKSKKNEFLNIEEKPIIRFFVNAGIYVFEKKILQLLKKNERINMNELFLKLKKLKIKNTVYPLIEDWFDVGNISDLNQFKKNLKRL